VEAAIDKTVYK